MANTFSGPRQFFGQLLADNAIDTVLGLNEFPVGALSPPGVFQPDAVMEEFATADRDSRLSALDDYLEQLGDLEIGIGEEL